MNYVNLENAKSLKELGFDVPVPGYYDLDRNMLVNGEPENTNAEFELFVSAPDFLTAADWLNKKYECIFIFGPGGTKFRGYGRGRMFSEPDGRDKAIALAIEQIKQRQNETQD